MDCNIEEEDGIGKKHQLFLNKLEQYKKDLPSIGPILKFYEKDFKNGLTKAIAESIFQLNNNAIKDNITFLVMGEPLLIKTNEVRTAIINHFVENEKNLSNGKVCSICGKTDSPVLDEPHGLVKIPKGQAAGCALISYNEPAFESYNLKGNLNSSICRDCARNYIEALKFLLSDGHPVVQKDKQKVYYEYNHRINLSDTTVVLFWTKHGKASISPFVISNPPDNLWIKGFFNSIWNGEKKKISTIDSNMFYCCTLSSAAARIAVRDWTSISLDEYKNNLAEWFRDIEIENREGEIIYSPLKLLINATQHDKKTGEKNKADTNSKTRMGSILWNSAIKGKSHMIPLEVLQYILNRIWKGDEFSTSRAAVIKLVINRNTNKKMKSTIEETNTSIAYLCGRLFAIIESMQWKAIGNVNNGVKERFFAAAAIQPAAIFGTLLTKNIPIYQHKIGGYLAKELNDIMSSISERGRIPLRFSTIEQGEFALGYYFQRNHKTNKETLNK